MKRILGLILLVTLFGFGAVQMNSTTEIRPLRIAFNSPWISISPGLQHTLIGDLTLSNQFEALVSFNENGVYAPLASKEWSASPDFKKLTFKIDTSRFFADGVRLSAKHFKSSWENALKLDPKSSNNSVLDVLYKIDGFSEFEKTGTISGIKVIDDETLELNFSSSFRMALEHLAGSRFSAYREVQGKFIGTGAYEISELGQDHLRLVPNMRFQTPPEGEIDLRVINTADSYQALLRGELDVMAYALGSSIPETVSSNEKVSVLVGQDAAHKAIYPNQQKGRLFEKREYRQALQYLAYEFAKKDHSLLGNPNFSNQDPQVYLPYQAGRIDESEVLSRVEQGKKFVDELRDASKLNPIVLLEVQEVSIRHFLESVGLTISDKSRIVSKSDLIKAIYDGQEADIIPGAFGVASGDPDGIYHLLGPQGAIASPMLKNKKVGDILEEGRKIVKRDEIDPFYKKVSKVILDEVPIVHLGFVKSVAVYRNDKVSISEKILRRSEGHLYIYKVK
tara:strand:- start:27320 stop:28840 length:1521 start_codon:yes stop_codon:yes gene_type:complete